MDEWGHIQDISRWFYLNSFSVGAMIPVAFFSITGFFLLSIKNKSKATLHLGIAYILMGVYNLGHVISSSVYHPAAAYNRWMAVAAILFAEIHFTMLFFHYPEEKNTRAARLYFRAAYLIVICILLYFFFQTLHAGITYIILDQYWDFNSIVPNKIIALAVLGFIFILPFLAFWRAAACKGKERWIVLLLGASILMGSLVPGIFNLLNREGIVTRSSFQMAWTLFTMAGFFLLIMLYVNNAREKISFVGKLITVTAITILTILHFISHYSLKDRDAAYDETHVKDAMLMMMGADFIPEKTAHDMAYKATLDLASGVIETPNGESLPVDAADVQRQLYNAAMVEKIRILPKSDFPRHLKSILAETPPHFEGYKRSLMAYADSLDLSAQTPAREMSAFINRLNRLTFIKFNKINQMPEGDFRNASTAYLRKNTGRDAFNAAIGQRLAESSQNGAALKAEILSLFVPMTGQGQRIYRASQNGTYHYIAFAVPDLANGKIMEAGFHTVITASICTMRCSSS